MSMYNDIPIGLRVPSNLPLDAKLWVKSSGDIETLGVSNNLAYTYYKGMRIYCADEKEIYEWMPVTDGNSLGLTALLDDDFTYPTGYVVNDIVYSDVAYNLYRIPQAWDVEVPDIENIGTGADIYKGLFIATNKHQFRRIITSVLQPIDPGQITGNILASAIVDGDNVVIRLDFSNLSVPLQQVGIPEYYVHSAADAAIADGSIVRPYKTWGACRDAIIGDGTYYNPDNNGVKVIFQTGQTSTEDLTIKNVTYAFENNSIFTYEGSETAVFDMDKLKANTNSSSNNFEGVGIIRTTDKNIVIRAGALSPTVAGESYFHVSIKSGSSIRIEKRLSQSYLNSHFEITDNGAGQPCYDGGQNPVYVLKKSGSADIVAPIEGILSIKGHNYPVWQPFGIETGATLTVCTNVDRAIYITDANLINYGNLLFDTPNHPHSSGVTVACVRYGEIDGAISGGNAIGRYTPSHNTSLMYINTPVSSATSTSSINTSSSGFVSGFLLGGTNQGGFNGIVELVGKSSTFQVTSNSPMTWNNKFRYNYLVYLADLDIQVTPGLIKRMSINNAYITSNFKLGVIGGVNGIDSSKFILSLGQGEISGIDSDKIITAAVITSVADVIKTNSFFQLAGKLYNTSLLNLDYTNNADAISNGLVRGMIYKTSDGTSSILKIVH